jgi:hypothetical protein
MSFVATDTDRVLLALVANGQVAFAPAGEVGECERAMPMVGPEEEGRAANRRYPQPKEGGEFAPALRQRLIVLLDAGLVALDDCGGARLTSAGLDVLRHRRHDNWAPAAPRSRTKGVPPERSSSSIF